jgi:hypothetical protein
MSDLHDEIVAIVYKHLPGKHSQKRHGWRYGGGVASARRSMRGEKDPKERAEYRKRAGMSEPKKVERKPEKEDITLDKYPTMKTIPLNDPIPDDVSSFVNNRVNSRIVIQNIKTGTEKQIEYASTLKLNAIRKVDETANNYYNFGKRKGLDVNVEKLATWRNKLMKAIDSDVDSRSILDKLSHKDGYRRSFDIDNIMKQYNIYP